MVSINLSSPGETSQIGTPRDYTGDLYRVYFEVGEFENSAQKILSKYLGTDDPDKIIKLAHGYEVELPIQCVPDIVRELAQANIAVYQVIRFAKIDGNWEKNDIQSRK